MPTKVKTREVTRADVESVLRLALGHSFGDDLATHEMTDQELTALLKWRMGEGGGGGPDTIDYWYNGSGLRIWASWAGSLNSYSEKPALQGVATLALVRELFHITNPDIKQRSFF